MITANGMIVESRREGAIGIFQQMLVIGATDRDSAFDIMRSHGYEPRNLIDRQNRTHHNWPHSYCNATNRDNYDKPCRNQDPNTPIYRYNHRNRNN